MERETVLDRLSDYDVGCVSDVDCEKCEFSRRSLCDGTIGDCSGYGMLGTDAVLIPYGVAPIAAGYVKLRMMAYGPAVWMVDLSAADRITLPRPFTIHEEDVVVFTADDAYLLDRVLILLAPNIGCTSTHAYARVSDLQKQ